MPDDSTFNLKNTRIYSHPSTWLFPPVDMADGIRRRTRGKTIDPRTRNGAGAQGRLDSQHQSDSESRPESEWVAELPIEEEDRDSCGNFMSGILSVTIKDPDLNIFTKEQEDRSGIRQWYICCESNIYKRRAIEEQFFDAFGKWQRSKAKKR